MKLALSCVLVALAACSPQNQGTDKKSAAPAQIIPAITAAPAGAYTLDKAHASLIFRVDHLGFSQFTARFARFDATLQFDPVDPAASRVSATIDPSSLECDNPPPGFLEHLRGAQWLDAAAFPEIAFRSTAVALTGANKARITGDFTLHGVTRPITLEATFNGGYAGHEFEPNARIGFSARGALKRSDFGIAYGLPPAGSTMGVGDEVKISIEAEFTGPPLAAGSPAP
jgi:polyisoprenoid-binding protein YceI